MILIEIQQYLSEQGRASLEQIALHFHMDEEALRGMLRHLVRKGRVRKLPLPEHCHGCTECRTECIEFYQSSC
ncbi:MAG: sugar metabolism transcriptional regulator [Symploca sp. SIO3C6]|uniref:Sugar metabolism transcriptional regulator n=1 Tax=Symploca sp. SIO1C4 TaxID=2607765 RepID=A0A6B3NFS6_9CYAN|nr:sugar metabolism transcriptional regulator [Symploca sp. SIO3C6]NER28108.1 sugar metabolism transcriptional regulator [Symploca sp. SIO1C4]